MKNIIILVILLITAITAKAQLPELRVVNLSKCNVDVAVNYYTGTPCSPTGPNTLGTNTINAGTWRDYNPGGPTDFDITVTIGATTLTMIYATSPGGCPRTTSANSSPTGFLCTCSGGAEIFVVSTNTSTTGPWIVFIYEL
jgi:hypothetical protein